MLLHFLKTHPFAVDAFFDHSLVLTYAFPVANMPFSLPQRLVPDLLEDKWAFIAVAVVSTRQLRPAGFPVFLGKDFRLIGYRIFVRYRTLEGRNLRGLYIIRSSADKRQMSFFGNIFTGYRYDTTDISCSHQGGMMQIASRGSGIQIVADVTSDNVELPSGSPFSDWKQARRFAGPMPFTFSCDEHQDRMVIIEGIRQHWQPRPVTVSQQEVKFIRELNIGGLRPASAFLVESIPYHWKKGRTELWK